MLWVSVLHSRSFFWSGYKFAHVVSCDNSATRKSFTMTFSLLPIVLLLVKFHWDIFANKGREMIIRDWPCQYCKFLNHSFRKKVAKCSILQIPFAARCYLMCSIISLIFDGNFAPNLILSHVPWFWLILLFFVTCLDCVRKTAYWAYWWHHTQRSLPNLFCIHIKYYYIGYVKLCFK